MSGAKYSVVADIDYTNVTCGIIDLPPDNVSTLAYHFNIIIACVKLQIIAALIPTGLYPDTFTLPQLDSRPAHVSVMW